MAKTFQFRFEKNDAEQTLKDLGLLLGGGMANLLASNLLGPKATFWLSLAGLGGAVLIPDPSVKKALLGVAVGGAAKLAATAMGLGSLGDLSGGGPEKTAETASEASAKYVDYEIVG